jgi:hypothetical protein
MSDRFNEIPGHIEKTLTILAQLVEKLDRFEKEIIPKIGRTKESVLIPVQILESGYTAVETLFMRISQAFENNLSADRWHADLLEKMTLEIVETRPRVLTEETYKKLSELMRFRHFKRYYFEMDFDWRKIDFLTQLFRESIPLLTADLRAFEAKIKTALG